MLSLNPKQVRVWTGVMISVVCFVFALFAVRPWEALSTAVVRASYDSLHALQGPVELGDSPVAIVYLDQASYRERGFDPARPWPREVHAELVNRLTKAGAKAVVFDIVFADAGANPSADHAFAQAIKLNGRVVLSADFDAKGSATLDLNGALSRSRSIIEPYQEFSKVAARWGIAAQREDEDFAVRQHLAHLRDVDSLSWAALSLVNAPTLEYGGERVNGFWLRYYGPPLSVPHRSYTEALASPEFFRDKIVFVGARPMTSASGRQDEFRNPFHGWGFKEYFSPGVEVHATALLNFLREDWLRRLAPALEMVILLLGAVTFGMGLICFRPASATFAASVGGALVAGMSIFGFARGIFFPWLAFVATQIPVALGSAILYHSLEWYRARRRLEAARRLDEAKIREQAALIEKAHDAIIVQKLSGAVSYANGSAERLYGWTFADLAKNGAMQEIFFPDAERTAIAREMALRLGEWNGELKQQTRSGKIVTVASRWTLIRDEQNQPKALLIMNSDITEQKILEAQFLRTQRMNTIGSLAGGVAHDLNNALAPILMGVQLLRRKTNDAESERLLALMERNTHRGADMVRQVLTFARGRGGEVARVDLRQIVAELEKIIRETFPKEVSVEVFLAKDLWSVQGNATEIYQTLLNLCVNARDAMPNGGRISIAADNVELSAEEASGISDARAGRFVSLLVADTGAGMPQEVQERIFEPFFTTKEPGRGTGIGLPTVQRIVKSHGGFLRLESQVGQGTTFELFFPAAAEEKIMAQAQQSAPQGHGELVIVADDEEAIRQLASEGLSANGYRVLSAPNGVEIIHLYRSHLAANPVLIADSSMPGMTRAELLCAIRELEPAARIIIASGQEDFGGEAATLRKPYTLQELLFAVHSILNKTTSTDA